MYRIIINSVISYATGIQVLTTRAVKMNIFGYRNVYRCAITGPCLRMRHRPSA